MTPATPSGAGPLADLRILEFASAGPGPLAATLLADMGAAVLRIDRLQAVELGAPKGAAHTQVLRRSREEIALDLKQPDATAQLLALVADADVLIEGFRPGVMERLGLGPDACLSRNPRLVYGRITGWGQTGPLAQAAGHDINYIAISGALNAVGRAGQPPTVPPALLGDMASGAMFLVTGVLAALHEARRSGSGQVVDANVCEGAAMLSAGFFSAHAPGLHDGERGTNLLDSGAPFYDVYRCADERWVSIGPLESRFFDALMAALDLPAGRFERHMPRAQWPALRAALAAAFRQRTMADWCARLEGSDVCFAPVLRFDEAPAHPHYAARGSFVEVGGLVQPAPAPRFSRTPSPRPRAPHEAAVESADHAIARWRAAAAQRTPR